MIRANIDTPWATDADRYVPQLVTDPAFSGLIRGWTDVTGGRMARVGWTAGQGR